MTRNLLHTLLDTGRRDWHPEYRDRLVSHLPMAQHALWALGADEDTLARFSQAQQAQLDPLPQAWLTPNLRPDWLVLRGHAGALRPLVAHFDAQLSALGTDTTLRVALPVLVDSCGAMAFHLLIRTAHALQAGHAGELALALGYWASRHKPLWNPPVLPPGDLTLPDWLAQVRALPAPALEPTGLISDRMSAWAATPGFQAVAARLRVDDAPALLAALAQWLALAYAASGNFTLLHGLTGSRALRLLLPLLPDPEATVQRFAVDLAAALLASRWRGEPVAADAEPAHWATYFRAAAAQDDEHVIKLVHACAEWALPATVPGQLPLPGAAPSPWAQAARRALTQSAA